MLILPLIVAAMSLAGFAAAQGVNANNTDEDTKEYWCTVQMESCPLICYQLEDSEEKPTKNNCDPDTLAYTCLCSNGLSPNATKFSQTIPYFICQEQNKRCVSQCDGVSSCQSDCRESHPCGAQDPYTPTGTGSIIPSATTSTADSDAVYTGFGDDSESTGGDSAAGRLAVETGRLYGVGIMVTGFLAGFTLLL